MSIQEEIIRKINGILGIRGKPRRILVDGEWIENGCYEWTNKRSPADIWDSISSEFQEAYVRSQKLLSDYPSDDPMVKLEEFFSNEPPQIQSEFRDFLAAVKGSFDYPNQGQHQEDGLPEMPPLLAEASERIQKKMDSANFMRGNEFDLDAYSARAQELWKEESDEIQKLLDDYRSLLQPMIDRGQERLMGIQDKLDGIRKLLIDYDLIAYGDLVIAPTKNQYDILRFEHTTAGNYGLMTENIIDQLVDLDQRYGIDIRDASTGHVEIQILRMPLEPILQELENNLLKLCPDLYESMPDISSGKIILWWD